MIQVGYSKGQQAKLDLFLKIVRLMICNLRIIFPRKNDTSYSRETKEQNKNVEMSKISHSILLDVTFMGTFKRVILMLLSVIG